MEDYKKSKPVHKNRNIALTWIFRNLRPLKNKIDHRTQGEILGSHTSLDSILLKIPSSRQVLGEAKAIVDLFNRYGAVVVEFSQDESPREQLLCFKGIFGDTMTHDRADEDMIAEIAVAEGFEGYLGTSNEEHRFHTDGAYSEMPPGVVALRCDVAAKVGGVTRLASGEGVYRELFRKDEDALRSLFAPDALCVSRAGKDSCQALFRSDGTHVRIRYRSDETTIPSKDARVQRGLRAIQEHLDAKENYMSFMLKTGQVLITDNTRTLHARTAFDKSEPRKMHRLFFTGDTKPGISLHLGFRA